jgi:hypothetical protein
LVRLCGSIEDSTVGVGVGLQDSVSGRCVVGVGGFELLRILRRLCWCVESRVGFHASFLILLESPSPRLHARAHRSYPFVPPSGPSPFRFHALLRGNGLRAGRSYPSTIPDRIHETSTGSRSCRRFALLLPFLQRYAKLGERWGKIVPQMIWRSHGCIRPTPTPRFPA